jgi:hypothetical protein
LNIQNTYAAPIGRQRIQWTWAPDYLSINIHISQDISIGPLTWTQCYAGQGHTIKSPPLLPILSKKLSIYTNTLSGIWAREAAIRDRLLALFTPTNPKVDRDYIWVSPRAISRSLRYHYPIDSFVEVRGKYSLIPVEVCVCVMYEEDKGYMASGSLVMVNETGDPCDTLVRVDLPISGGKLDIHPLVWVLKSTPLQSTVAVLDIIRTDMF